MLTSERRKSLPAPIPLPSRGNKQYHFVAFSKAKEQCQCLSTGPERRIHQLSFRSLPPPALCLPRPGGTHFPCYSGGLGPTLTEEEEADEEQVELGRFHSSARRGRAGGQLGLAMSFPSSAPGAQPAPRSSPGRPPAVCPAVPRASGSRASGLRSQSAQVAVL